MINLRFFVFVLGSLCMINSIAASDDIASTISQLRNRSNEPKLPARNDGFKVTAQKLSLDLDEQARILDLLTKINVSWNEEVWELLVANDDDSYCITVQNDNDFLANWSVRDVCTRLAELQISDRITEVLMLVEPPPTKEHVGYIIDLFDGASVSEWRKKHIAKNYAQLQVELTSMAIAIVKDDESISSDNKETVVSSLKELRNTLERVVRPQFLRIRLMSGQYEVLKE